MRKISSDPMWHRQLLAALPGAAVGLGIGVSLHWTNLAPATRILLSSLPMFFLFELLNPVANTDISSGRHVRRAATYAVVVSAALWGIVLAA